MKRNTIYTILALLLTLSATAQVPVANFSGTPASGCAPLLVTFTDQSTGSPKFWNWDFGNGQLSNAQNPVATYTVPGTYTVTLVVQNLDGTNAITKTNYITVYPSPQAAFTADITTGCVPVTVNFTDASTSGAGAINKWEWDFGDGTKSNQQNPQHTYTASGYYTVLLRVTSVNGCAGAVAANRYIRVVAGINADFNNDLPSTCKPPLNVRLNNQTSGPGTLNYTWDLGNGNTSTAINPVTSYPAAGTYNVKLYVQSDLGCKDSVQKTITLNSLTTAFTSADSACPGQPISFMNTSSPPAPSFTWDFGDNTQSGALNPIKSYGTVGTYNVKLINRYSNCTDSVNKIVTITNVVVADFTAPATGACKPPFTANFQNNTPGAVSWQWNFGDGGISNLQNPSHTYTSVGQYDETLTVKTAGGCDGTITKTKFIKVLPGNISITNIPMGGCLPLNFTPTLSNTSPDPIASYSWNFGDGFTSNAPNPSHVYNTAGVYNMSVSVTTLGGCTLNASYPGGVRVGTPPPVADFSASNTVPCTSASTLFTDLSSSPITNEWLWDFGDGDKSTLQNPVHTFSNVGTFSVTLTAMNNGCGTTVTKNNFITVLPPVAKYKVGVNCAAPFTANFTDQSILAAGPVVYAWQFGSPSLGSSAIANPSFTFPAEGNYPVTLTVTNGGCTNSLTDTVRIKLPKASFSVSKPVLCKFEHFVLSAGADTNLIKKFTWQIGSGTPFVGLQTFDTSLTVAGTYDITLTVTDIYGCTNTLTQPGAVKISGPQAAFTAATNGGCRNTIVTFNDASTSPVGISKWTWNFGDGTVTDFMASPFTHQYINAGIYTVHLTVTDNSGCTDTASISGGIKITQPRAGFKVDQQVFCPGVSLPFIDTSSGSNLTYFWDFGDGNTSTLQNPQNIYAGADNNYTVKLRVTDDVGCSDSVIKSNYVQIKKPKPAFTFQDSTSICNLLETKFFFSGQDYDSFEWDFGDGSTTTAMNPSHFYNTYGNFTAKLYLYGNGGCVDSASRQVNLINPYTATQLNYNPLNACNQLNVDFTVAPPANTIFSLFFGDGTADSSQQLSLQHLYNVPGYYTPLVLLKDQYDCQAAIGGSNRIQVLGALPLYNIDNRKFCDSGNVFITNYTIGNDPIVSQVWDLGDNTTSNAKDPVHFYAQPGLYPVTLTVTTQAGCVRARTDTIRVLRTPHPIINADDTICINQTVPFNATLAQADTAITWNWDFGDGRTSVVPDNIISYSQTGTYTVKLGASNSLGCRRDTAETVLVAPNPVVGTKDVVIPVGGSVPLPVTYSNGIATYTWTPAAGLNCTDCALPVASPQFTTKYNVRVFDSNQCTIAGSLTVTVICTEKNYFVPNTFSPNGDGMNDVFYPRGNGLTRVQSMRIFNRWGQIVFERRDFDANVPSQGWDGRVNGQLAPQDVYVYMIEFVCNNAQIVPFKGNVTLIR